jgi:hypothetical protein
MMLRCAYGSRSDSLLKVLLTMDLRAVFRTIR